MRVNAPARTLRLRRRPRKHWSKQAGSQYLYSNAAAIVPAEEVSFVFRDSYVAKNSMRHASAQKRASPLWREMKAQWPPRSGAITRMCALLASAGSEKLANGTKGSSCDVTIIVGTWISAATRNALD